MIYAARIIGLYICMLAQMATDWVCVVCCPCEKTSTSRQLHDRYEESRTRYTPNDEFSTSLAKANGRDELAIKSEAATKEKRWKMGRKYKIGGKQRPSTDGL